MDDRTIIRAFHDAQARRPYKLDEALVKAATPPGGDWTCIASEGDAVLCSKEHPADARCAADQRECGEVVM
jgi:hypothetical protein